MKDLTPSDKVIIFGGRCSMKIDELMHRRVLGTHAVILHANVYNNGSLYM